MSEPLLCCMDCVSLASTNIGIIRRININTSRPFAHILHAATTVRYNLREQREKSVYLGVVVNC